MLFPLMLQRILLLLIAGISAPATGAGLKEGRVPLRGSIGFLEANRRTAPSLLSSQLDVFLRPNSPRGFLYSSQAPSPPPVADGRVSPKEVPLLSFVNWGRGPTAPEGPEELLMQQQVGSSSNGVRGVLYCTAWDTRSKALVSAIGLLQHEALGISRGPEGPQQEEAPILPVYPITGIKITNSLVIARGRRALLKQRRMACNMKQLRHNERALRFMLQQQPPLQLQGLPTLQLYTQQQQEGNSLEPPLLAQLVEIRSVAPGALQQLGADEEALLGAWGPQGAPGGPHAHRSLGAWLKRLGHFYEEELKRIVQERLQQAEEEYPIYKSFNP